MIVDERDEIKNLINELKRNDDDEKIDDDDDNDDDDNGRGREQGDVNGRGRVREPTQGDGFNGDGFNDDDDVIDIDGLSNKTHISDTQNTELSPILTKTKENTRNVSQRTRNQTNPQPSTRTDEMIAKTLQDDVLSNITSPSPQQQRSSENKNKTPLAERNSKKTTTNGKERKNGNGRKRGKSKRRR